MVTDVEQLWRELQDAAHLAGGLTRAPNSKAPRHDPGTNLPDDLHRWLEVCDSAELGQLCLCGRSRSAGTPAIADIVSAGWAIRDFIPIAIDTTGCYYAIATNGGCVAFVDEDNLEEPAYAIASGLYPFIRIIIRSLRKDRDPQDIDRAFLLEIDPDLAKVRGLPLAWMVE
ncbi:MAG: hypothetical protein IT435_14955 [Phycisphaerales bacterium]|nr:hypothetical protein [Phycisphaerales bacterium]